MDLSRGPFIGARIRRPRWAPLLASLALALASTFSIRAQTSSLALLDGIGDVSRESAISAAALLFTENRGQVVDTRGTPRPDILYTLRSRGVSLYLLRDRVSYVFARYEERSSSPDGEVHPVLTGMHRMDMELVGSNATAAVEPSEPVNGHTNFYLAHVPDGIVGVPSFQRITYREVYPHIDMVLSVSDGGVKCDFVVHPGGRVADIRMRYRAAESVRVESNGALLATTPLGRLEEDAPYTYESGAAGGRRVVPSRYEIDGDVVRFDVGAYDSSRTLVVDPTRTWATYYGGSGQDRPSLGGSPITVDRRGDILITGYSTSTNFPVSTGAYQTSNNGGHDAIVVKLSASGARLWATYYGGSIEDDASAIAADGGRNAIIVGKSYSTDFPTTTGAFQTSRAGANGTHDAFVVTLDTNGARLWATYYGGRYNDEATGVAADSAGNLAIVMMTQSDSLGTAGTYAASKPTRSASDITDILVVRMSPSGARVWATYFGGDTTDVSGACALDSNGNVFVAGYTMSTNLPTTTGAHQTTYGGSVDAFVARFDTSGGLGWATYYGGSGTEGGSNTGELNPNSIARLGIATDSSGSVYFGGVTSGGFSTTTGAAQTTHGGGHDGFLIKLNAGGARVWATYLGGSGLDGVHGVTTTSDGELFVAGVTNSTNFPISTDAHQTAYGGGTYDAFITQFTSTGTRLWSTYLGGTALDIGMGIAVDRSGAIAVTGWTGGSFPVTTGALQTTYGGNGASDVDFFIAQFCHVASGRITARGATTFCDGDSVVLRAPAGYDSYLWSNSSTADSIIVRATGSYTIRLSRGACPTYSDTVRVQVNAKPTPGITVIGATAICAGDSTTLDAGEGFASYRWSNGATTQRIIVKEAGRFNVRVTNALGCADSARAVTITIKPRPNPVTITASGSTTLCAGESVVLTATGSDGTYRWSNGRTTQSITVTEAGTYGVSVSNPNGCSVAAQPVAVTVHAKPQVTIYPNGPTTFCDGNSVTLSIARPVGSWQWSTGDTSLSIVARESGVYEVAVTDTNGCRTTQSIDVAVKPPPQPTVFVQGPTSFCWGDSTELVAYGGDYVGFIWSTGEATQRIVVKSSGRYSVSVIDRSGCFGRSDTVEITVLPSPVAVLSGPIGVCVDARAEYSVAADADVTYEWRVSGAGGEIISGAGTPSVTVQWGGSGTGTVEVIASRRNGCSARDRIDVTVGSSLVPKIAASRSLTFCDGDSVTLDAGQYESYLWSNGATTRRIIVQESGSYSVAVRQGACSGSSQALAVSVVPIPEKPTIVRDGNMLIAPVAAAYQWSRDGQPIPGAIVRQILATHNGAYTVVVANAEGCASTSDPLHVTLVSAVTATTGTSARLQLHPNPARNKLTVQLATAAGGALWITLVDLMGRDVLSIEDYADGGPYRRDISLESIPDGAYIVRVVTVRDQWHSPLVVRR